MKTAPKEIIADKNLVAYCGLYCGACRSYLTGKCKGCNGNEKATWCKIRQCCMENKYLSCADCTTVELKDCKKFNNMFAKIIGLVLNSDRTACIDRIKEKGYEEFASEMTVNKRQTLGRR